VLLIFACKAFHQRDVERVDIDGGAETIGEKVVSKLSGIVYPKNPFLIARVDG
jgi:hypothetical protein